MRVGTPGICTYIYETLPQTAYLHGLQGVELDGFAGLNRMPDVHHALAGGPHHAQHLPQPTECRSLGCLAKHGSC